MYLSKEGMSFFKILHKAPISRTSPGEREKGGKKMTGSSSIWIYIDYWHRKYSRAKISCCLVNVEPLVGRKFSSSNDTYEAVNGIINIRNIIKRADIHHISWNIHQGKKVFRQPPGVQVLRPKKMKSVIFIVGIPQLWDKMRGGRGNPENHIVWFLKKLFANYDGK